jgi:hypothetical protein
MKTLATQHWVLCPNWSGPMTVQPIYAPTAEEAVANTRTIFAEASDIRPVDIESIRLATEAELPWNNPSLETWVGEERQPDGLRPFQMTMPEIDVRDLFRDRLVSLRPATPEEREMSFRLGALDQDLNDDEEFDRGWNGDR